MAKSSRSEMLARYILKYKATIRQTASYFGMAKSTVHLDVSKRLKFEDFRLYQKIKKILDNNWAEKHLRGGYSTKLKWENKKRTF